MNSSMKKEIKAVITDIDGTITDERRRLSLDVVQALRKVEENGIAVMLASGNVLPIAYGLSSFIGTSGPVIAENGGIVWYDDEVKLLATRDRCNEAFELLQEQLPVKKIFTDRWRLTEVAIETDVELVKIREILESKELKVETTGFAIHIFEPHVSKFEAAKIACELIGIETDNVAAFGDSENDVEMISGCGIGIVPSNGMKAVKDVADHVTRNPNGQGVIEGLKNLGILD